MKAVGLLVLLAIALLTASCGTSERRQPEPDEPPQGTLVETLTVDTTEFQLYRESADCLAVDIIHESVQRTVERGCTGNDDNGVWLSEACGFLERDAGNSGSGGASGGCDVTLPQVFFGQVSEPVSYVCVAVLGERASDQVAVESVRFLSARADGVVFSEARDGEGDTTILFVDGGSLYGDRELDRAPEAIRRACEAAGPWQ